MPLQHEYIFTFLRYAMGVLVFALVLASLTAAFALQNTESVTVRMLLWEYQTSLVLVILGSVGIGIVLTFLSSLGRRWKRSTTIRSLQSTVDSQGARIRELEEALRLFRTPPPTGIGIASHVTVYPKVVTGDQRQLRTVWCMCSIRYSWRTSPREHPTCRESDDQRADCHRKREKR